jgi:preprotein translocase subunit SecF
MTITRNAFPGSLNWMLLLGMLALVPVGVAGAWQSTPASRSAQSSSLQYQQSARQQQTRDQLQKSQLQQQLHQGVSDNARLPNAANARSQRQQDEAERAQRDRDRASQQDLLDRERDTSTLPRVIPKDLPAPTRSSG